jgi:hypothetical protein
MVWIRPLVLILIALRSVAILFSADASGQREISNLFHFSPSDSGSILRATTPVESVWQLVGVGLVLWLHVSAWHLLWWVLLGYVVFLLVGRLLMWRAKS